MIWYQKDESKWLFHPILVALFLVVFGKYEVTKLCDEQGLKLRNWKKLHLADVAKWFNYAWQTIIIVEVMHKILDPWAMAHHHIIIEITFCTASCQAQGCQINPRGASNTSSVPASLKRGAEKNPDYHLGAEISHIH